MTNELYACLYASEFPAQALLRMRTGLAGEAVAVLDGAPPLQTVCSLNRAARQLGAASGMSRLEAESIAGLQLLVRSAENDAAARLVMLECAARFSPRIEDVSPPTACSCVLDIAGTERLFGAPAALAERLRDALAEVGLRASVAVSGNFHTARLKAAATRGMAVIPSGHEAAALSRLPVAALGLPQERAETLALWGIRTLEELAALPEDELVSRLGAEAATWRKLAQGALAHTFQPVEAGFTLRECCAFETAVEQSDSLLFCCARIIDCLTARAAARALSLASLAVEMRLEGGQAYSRVIRPAIPTTDRKFLLKLLQLEIAAHPPQSAVLAVALTAEPGLAGQMQLGLFAPQTPEPTRLEVTIARLKAIAGEDRVGSPVLEDSHRPGAFRMNGFSVAGQPATAAQPLANPPRMALRRIRPPVTVRVEMREQRPTAFRDGERRYRIAAAYGPWRASGAWWSPDGWDCEEWDVLAESEGATVACLLVKTGDMSEGGRGIWQLEAFYD